jgi:hypothetical protein
MSLNLPSRAAKIGSAINTRTEKHGDEDVAALDIPVTFVLDPIELCWLLKSEEAAHRLFISAGGNHGEKAMPAIGALSLREKIEGAKISLVFEGLMGDVALDFTSAKLAKVKVNPLFAGKSDCSLTIQVCPDLDDTAVLALLGHMNGECQLAIMVDGYNAQIALPLGTPPETTEEEA